MKINGKTNLANDYREVVFLPRGEDDGIEFIVKAVHDIKLFNQVCPEPKPNTITKKGGEKVVDYDSKEFRDRLMQYGRRRMDYTFLMSISETEGLEWETVDMGDPTTWELHRQEMADAGIADHEYNLISQAVIRVNNLNQDLIDKAYARFLATKSGGATENSQAEEVDSI